ncbi:GspE/PulE family protein [Engelhardtia mirabilis]|uniref:Type II secretion system protein E n=1 Tax=Engelhardtia mirabilis TaxID=2528011 RepID=A0A518BP78_9BACT|nr:Type II secretion system protein E [Planctomycetes bacterium Pla133]QDV03105.1 Type II secretion system protein E [Planctomycetes bacterium Pla86]
MVRISGKIRRLLIDAELIDAEEWETARDAGSSPVDALIESGRLPEIALFEALGGASGVVPICLERVNPDPAALDVLPRETLFEHCVLPLVRNGDVLTVAVADPFDLLLLDDLNIIAGCKVRPVLSHPAAIREALEKVFDDGKAQVDELLDQVNDADLEIQENVDQDASVDLSGAGSGEDVPAVKLANLILLRALREKASDIHIEPGEKNLRIRLRIDGRLVEAMRPPKSILSALISRLKIMASLDIAERFSPQDGKFQIRYEGRAIDFRLSTLPVVGGEKAVMRILDSSGVAHSLEKLGYEPKCLADMQKAIAASYGMVLVTGPTGSGKSTTLYASVKEVATPEINVVTVEDPVEYRMDGINQVPVNPKRGMTFAGALRSILRQDPDVVLVGEIRDVETAEIGIKAALTGHLVLSTLHTNDAAGAITRLIDMGIDPFMVSSSLLCVAAQRLARVLCPNCRVPLEPLPDAKLIELGFLEEELEGLELWAPNPAGCARCSGGYKGRFAILETLYLDATIKRMVVEGASVHEIKSEAINQGMVTLRRAGLMNAKRGKSSLEEVLRVTMAD